MQESGRAGRDGEPSISVLLRTKAHIQHVHQVMKDYCINNEKCRRDALFEEMDEYIRGDIGPKCLCCDVCAKNCPCGACEQNNSKFILL